MGRVCASAQPHARANDPLMGELYDPAQPTSWITANDANSLYPSVMAKRIPLGGFQELDLATDGMQELEAVLIAEAADPRNGAMLL
eukprot:1552113-Alexandrium_andersonii.AAC.1